jgi:tRNA-2-methylthio-N6-dimethylallyladenosine synthase
VKYYIENFGCQMNEHDMEKAVSLLDAAGHEASQDITGANVVVVNTCCVRQKAEQKFYSFMGRLRSLKRRRGIVVGVTGCIAQLEKDSILERLPFVDFSLGPSNIHRIGEAIDAVIGKRKFLEFSENGQHSSLFVRPRHEKGGVKSFVTIMKGCNNFCSYCVVPYVRGREASRPSADILEEIVDLARAGIKEVVLLGQNVNSYNRATDDISFCDLLARIDRIEGIERIRFVTSHPRDFSDDLIDSFADLEKLCEQIHLPFQSGSDRILKLMNRGYTAEEYAEKVERLKLRCPNVAITADCIVGFPGENDHDFQATMDLMNRIRFDGVFSFSFSPRKFTRAVELADAVPTEISSERLQKLQAFQKNVTQQHFKMMEGKREEVLVEGPSKNSPRDMTGRTRTNRIVNFPGTLDMIGKLVDVEIVKGYANSLRGADPRLKEV